ncbi:MAG TPA: GMC family oxidoreductase N-terminal domain-containing protein, partial [Candidatus Eremiobacteraceae bacterium]|nr:GMC family oxidoreductase N-terminal domain-containing protein [Candidatus Eremiobacteraceae bacterium]
MPSTEMSERERAVVEALFDTIAPERSDRAAGLALLVEKIGCVATHRFARLRRLLWLLDSPWFSYMRIRVFARFGDLALSDRERLLRSMADSDLALVRAGFQAFKRLCAFAAYACVDAQGRNPLWEDGGYPGPRSDRTPGPALALARAGGSIDCDAVVIGSGAGGGVAAALLAARGQRVVVLELGPATDPSKFTQREADAFGAFYLDAGLTATDDLAISILAGSCVGGGTTVNWCTALRLGDRVAAQWSSASGGVDFGASLEPHYAAIESRLAVAPTSEHNANNAAIARGCAALGWRAIDSPRNASGCGDGCGYCGFGCAYDHKRSTAATYLRDAIQAGAQVMAGVTVERITIVGGRVTGVEATTSDGARVSVRAPLVVACAGSLRTPALLARSGVSSSHLGRHLRLHPTTAVFA